MVISWQNVFFSFFQMYTEGWWSCPGATDFTELRHSEGIYLLSSCVYMNAWNNECERESWQLLNIKSRKWCCASSPFFPRTVTKLFVDLDPFTQFNDWIITLGRRTFPTGNKFPFFIYIFIYCLLQFNILSWGYLMNLLWNYWHEVKHIWPTGYIQDCSCTVCMYVWHYTRQ